MTNEEKIKAMTTEELARLIDRSSCNCCVFASYACENRYAVDCIEGIKKWLKQEVE